MFIHFPVDRGLGYFQFFIQQHYILVCDKTFLYMSPMTDTFGFISPVAFSAFYLLFFFFLILLFFLPGLDLIDFILFPYATDLKVIDSIIIIILDLNSRLVTPP